MAASEETGEPSGHMLATVKQFYQLDDAVDARGMAAVEEIMALVHKDARYIHMEYDANYDKAAWLDGYERRIARALTRHSVTTITNSIVGKNIVITERRGTYEFLQDGVWQPQSYEKSVATYEFRDSKLWRIREYWD